MGVFETILIILEALCSIALIGVVLMQSGKEEGLSGALSGSSNSYMNKNKSSGIGCPSSFQASRNRQCRCCNLGQSL